jgi:hypothetical protein
VEPDDAGAILIVKMTVNRVPNLGMKAGKIIGLGDDVQPNRAGNVPTLRRFFDDEMNFGHGNILWK